VVSPSAAEEFVAVPPEVAAEPIAERAAIVPPPEPLPTNLNPQS